MALQSVINVFVVLNDVASQHAEILIHGSARSVGFRSKGHALGLAFHEEMASTIADHPINTMLVLFPGLVRALIANIEGPSPQRRVQDLSHIVLAGIAERLGETGKKLRSTFQSRFGPEEWLQPYTDKTVEQLARDGVKSIAVFNPGFVSDCLETLEEIAVEAGEIFHHAGGENFTHIPCLNDSTGGMHVIEAVVRRELSGWL